MDQNIQHARGKKPYAQPSVDSRKMTLGVYGNYAGGGSVIGFNDPSGGPRSGSADHRNPGLADLAP